MTISIRALALSSAVISAAFPAYAADMYRAPAPAAPAEVPYVAITGWTGFYAGLNGGYSFDEQQRHTKMLDEGGFGGGQIGYNWQGFLSPNIVLGLESDFEGAAIDHSASVTVGGVTGTHKRAINEFGTVRGRVGYAAGPMLLFATGGFAYGNKTNEISLTNGNLYKEDGWETGYVAGGGVEYKFSPSWSGKVEYQFINLDQKDATDQAGASLNTVDTQLSTVRAGLNYHFGAGYAPLK
jgi:outer membrane immunogenic protein